MFKKFIIVLALAPVTAFAQYSPEHQYQESMRQLRQQSHETLRAAERQHQENQWQQQQRLQHYETQQAIERQHQEAMRQQYDMQQQQYNMQQQQYDLQQQQYNAQQQQYGMQMQQYNAQQPKEQDPFNTPISDLNLKDWGAEVRKYSQPAVP